MPKRGRPINYPNAKLKKHDLEFLTNLLDKGSIKPVINRLYPLDKASETMHYISQGHPTGKVIVLMAPR